jgi:hypothetical protein
MNTKWKFLIGLSLCADLVIGATVVAMDVYYDKSLIDMAKHIVITHTRINKQIKALEVSDETED